MEWWGGKRGLEWKWREKHYGWDFIFSGEVVEGNYIFFHDRGSVFSQWARLGFRVGVNYSLLLIHQLKNCLCMRKLNLLVIC